MPEESVGTVIHYFGKIGVAALTLTGRIKVGDTLRFKGHTTDFTETLESMQIDNAIVEEAGPGDDVGIKVKERVREHDEVFVVTE
jgi:putative protease